MIKPLPTKYDKKLIRHFLKRQKKPFYIQIRNILETQNDLSAREISSILYEYAIAAKSSPVTPFQKTQLISNISKDFTQELCVKLATLNVTRYFSEEDKIFKYIKS